MSEQRNVVIRVILAVWALLMGRPANGSFLSRQRRWVTGGIGALGVSGLILGGFASPASAAGLPGNVDLEQWASVNSNWVTGDLGLSGANASNYTEGDVVPFRLDVTTAGAGTFGFSVCRDYMNGAVRGYLSLQPYNTTLAADITSLVVTSPATGAAQPFTGAAVVGGVHIDSVNEVGGHVGMLAGVMAVLIPFQREGEPGELPLVIESRQITCARMAQDLAGIRMLAQIDGEIERVRLEALAQPPQLRFGHRPHP